MPRLPSRKIRLETLAYADRSAAQTLARVARATIRDHLGAAARFRGQGTQVWEVAQSSSVVDLRTLKKLHERATEAAF